eukprot:43920_1
MDSTIIVYVQCSHSLVQSHSMTILFCFGVAKYRILRSFFLFTPEQHERKQQPGSSTPLSYGLWYRAVHLVPVHFLKSMLIVQGSNRGQGLSMMNPLKRKPVNNHLYPQ